MPLKTGSSAKTIGSNIKELESDYAMKHKIGNNKPASASMARKMAVAIALKKAGKNKK